MYQTYQVGENENLITIGKKLNIDPYEIAKINGILLDTPLVPNSYIVVPAMDNQIYEEYTVQKGDNLHAIAARYGTTVNDLALLNGMKENEYIYPNEILLIPKKGVQLYVTKEGDTLNETIKNLDALPLELVLQNQRIYLVPNQLILYRKGIQSAER